MEVVLEGAEGVPEGGVLFMKVGGTKWQAPVGKPGQSFRFGGPPAGPLPLQVELLVPAGPAQRLVPQASPEGRFAVDFGGGMRVRLRQRTAQELQRPVVDLASAAGGGSLPAEKRRAAQSAAAYLEEHGLIRSFQELLHALLVSKPEDPHRFMEDHLATAKKLAANAASASRRLSGARAPRASVRESTRGTTTASRNKVETLLMTLQSAHDNLPLVLPLLPRDLRQMLEGRDLAEECVNQFKSLDTKGTGTLLPEDLLPVIEQLSSAKAQCIDSEQCRRFVEMFDADEDGSISVEEFTGLVQFVIVAGFLESPEGRQIIEMAMIEENAFQDFLAMIEKDKERLWSIIPFLPEWLVEHITSAAFQQGCNKHFASLDADGSGSLEPRELISVIQALSEAHPLIIDQEKCRQFTALFDTHKNGVIMRDEFIEFAQFITVMNFLSSTTEGQRVRQRSDLEVRSARTQRLIELLEKKQRRALPEVLQSVPQALVSELTGTVFKEQCLKGFAAADPKGTGRAEPKELFPLVCTLCAAHPFRVNKEQCKNYAAMFDGDQQGVVSKESFPEMAQYVILMSWLQYTRQHQDLLASDILLGQERINKLLAALAEGAERIDDLIPFLPDELTEKLLSESFARQCGRDFKELDKDGSGALEPTEVFPLLSALTEAHQLALTEEHCRHFVRIFDVEQEGVITEGEFVNFVRFTMIMAFMETEEGQRVKLDLEIKQGKEAVDMLLQMLEEDRKAIHKVVPLLPQAVFAQLTSDALVTACHERFVQLDVDRVGVLRPQELYPVVVELSAAHPYAVSEDQCKRFTAIFNVRGDGVLREDEFLDFTRFLCIMSYLHTPEGKAASKEALEILAESKQIEDLLSSMEADRQNMHKVIPFLPDWLKEDLLSKHFTIECLQFFTDLDKDGSGSLEPEELLPIVQVLSKAHTHSLDLAQCRRFAAIFAEGRSGGISRGEFVEFSRFLIVMSYLKSEEGKEVMLQAARGKQPHRPPGPMSHLDDQEPLSVGPSSPAHLAVDCEFYQKKSEKLNQENEALRERLGGLEQLMRKMEAKLEDQGQRLRHAELDLRGPRR